jgi:hypothetical protein
MRNDEKPWKNIEKQCKNNEKPSGGQALGALLDNRGAQLPSTPARLA